MELLYRYFHNTLEVGGIYAIYSLNVIDYIDRFSILLEFTIEIKNEFKEKMPFLNEYSGYTQTTFLPLFNRSLLGKIRLRGFSSKRGLSIGVS